ncbi:MAG: SoxR reducing system RseC family protein [Christensenellales bacterium]|jgi:sigma-E factor negative regulatory protein RseC
MIETGKVISVDKEQNSVTVEFDRKSACGKCGMCLMSADKMKVELTLKNNLGAEVEDYVEVKIADSFVLSAALIVYIIPVIIFGIALFITRNMSEEIQIIVGGVSLVAGMAAAFIADRKIRNHKASTPEIINILKPKEESNNE